MSVSSFKRLFLAPLFLALLLLVARPTGSAQEQLTVTYEEFPPYSFTNTDGGAEGFSIDMIKHLATAAGYELRFVPSINPARSLELVESGEAQITTLLALTPERLERALPTLETGAFELSAFVRNDQGFARPEDLSGMRIGATEGSFAVVGARMIPFADIVEYAATDNAVMPLLTGEIDAVVSASNVFLARLREAGLAGQVAALSPALISSPHGFLVNQGRADVRDALNAAIESGLTPSVMAALQERWFGRPARLTDNPTTWLFAGSIALLLVGIAALVARLYRYKAEASRLLRSNRANDLLIKALDKINGAIVIYDKDMRAVHRNVGFAKCFPSVVPLVDAGMDMRSLIGLSYRDGTINSDMESAERDAFLDGIIAAARNGTSNLRTVQATNGLVYEARDFQLGADHFASIRVDVTAQFQQQETIRQQATLLENANEQLQSFSSIAAHDLQSPLRNIGQLIEFVVEDLAEQQGGIPAPVQDNLRFIQSQITQMMQLVEDLLLYARAGSEDGRPQRIEPGALINRAVALIAPSDKFQITVANRLPDLHADPTAFETVVRNLISNAIKHHDKGEGTISVHATQRAGFLDIHITDDGGGISEQHRETIFEPFKRLPTRATHGSGLGLAYIKRTVEQWGGEVTVAAAHPRGSTFTVSVPNSDPAQLH